MTLNVEEWLKPADPKVPSIILTRFHLFSQQTETNKNVMFITYVSITNKNMYLTNPIMYLRQKYPKFQNNGPNHTLYTKKNHKQITAQFQNGTRKSQKPQCENRIFEKWLWRENNEKVRAGFGYAHTAKRTWGIEGTDCEPAGSEYPCFAACWFLRRIHAHLSSPFRIPLHNALPSCLKLRFG